MGIDICFRLKRMVKVKVKVKVRRMTLVPLHSPPGEETTDPGVIMMM